MRLSAVFVLIAVLAVAGCTNPSTAQTPPVQTPPAEPSVTANNQQAAAGSVTVAAVTATEAGWMAIHAASASGPGEVIGQVEVPAGSVTNVLVPIDEAKATTTLYAMLHVDKGQTGVYEFPGPDAPVTLNGEVVMASFSIATGTEPGTTVNQTEPQTHMVTITDAGFSPQTSAVRRGDTVTWKNVGTQGSWPASAFHPTHTKYPGSDITKCPDPTIFDACQNIAPGGEWSFTFTEIGEWAYHDHSHPNLFGKITVQA